MLLFLGYYFPDIETRRGIAKYVKKNPSSLKVIETASSGVFIEGFIKEECNTEEFPFFQNYQNKHHYKVSHAVFFFNDSDHQPQICSKDDLRNRIHGIPGTENFIYASRLMNNSLFLPTENQIAAMNAIKQSDYYSELVNRTQLQFCENKSIFITGEMSESRARFFINHPHWLIGAHWISINKYGRISFCYAYFDEVSGKHRMKEVFHITRDQYWRLGNSSQKISEFIDQIRGGII